MPRIGRPNGVIVRMYHGDHGPPHLHAEFQEHEALVDLKTDAILHGDLPKKAYKALTSWMSTHRKTLLANWDLGQKYETMEVIEECVDD